MNATETLVAKAAKAFNEKRDALLLENLSRLLGEAITVDDVDRLRGRVSVSINESYQCVVTLDGEAIMMFTPPRYIENEIVCHYMVMR